MLPSQPPGLARRLAALLYDSLLLLGVLFAATLLALAFRGGAAFRPGDPLFAAYLLAVTFLFFGWCWTHGGQTLGMRAWKIRLVAADGGAVTWRQSGLRGLAALVSVLCLGLGYFWALVDSRNRGWPELLSGTRLEWDGDH